ncbi:hypothetical protein O3G_MSEX003683 [Manduca sexta]|uniref:Uncharacterized protein n=1 Tax=Manduca sexta TaxID=7130 RepID=A0A922CGS4_MANSE|nr:hypothetical protein O3G_MSEX003683 [Manduca sexta]
MHQFKKQLQTIINDKLGYFGDHSSLSGVSYVFSTSPIPWFKRCFWFSTLTACCFGSYTVLKESLSLYIEDAVNYSVETNYLEWDTPFPAITLCEHADTDRVKEYIMTNNISSSLTVFLKDVVFWNAKFCKSCHTCKINQTCVNNFTQFHPIPTEYGLCFAFNSRLTDTTENIQVNRKIGLPSLVFTAVQPLSIKIHSPDEIVSVAMEKTLTHCGVLPLVSDFEAILKAEETINDPSVQSIPARSRDCLFSHERPNFADNWPFSKYSYSACALYRRAQTQIDVCNCTHHFMPTIGDYPSCNISGLACLHKNRELLAVEGTACPMECDSIIYTASHVSCSRHTGKLPGHLSQRGTRGLVKLGQLPSLRVRRHAIRDMLGLVVDFGGVVGVFFGASLLSIMEIIYLLFIRRNN